MVDRAAQTAVEVKAYAQPGRRLGRTQSICPRCRQVLDAELARLARDAISEGALGYTIFAARRSPLAADARRHSPQSAGR